MRHWLTHEYLGMVVLKKKPSGNEAYEQVMSAMPPGSAMKALIMSIKACTDHANPA